MDEVMGCRDAVDRLWAYLDGELDEGDHKFVEQHLAFCLQCCRELSMAEELRNALATSRTDEVPGDVRQRLEGFISALDPTAESGNQSPAVGDR